MFRCFDSLEFELKDVSSSSTGFSSRANLGSEASSQLASLFRTYPHYARSKLYFGFRWKDVNPSIIAHDRLVTCCKSYTPSNLYCNEARDERHGASPRRKPAGFRPRQSSSDHAQLQLAGVLGGQRAQ